MFYNITIVKCSVMVGHHSVYKAGVDLRQTRRECQYATEVHQV
jgi:hypothetical protein